MKLKSRAFQNNDLIPGQHSGEGRDISPAIEWSEVPRNTREFALLCEDPDAPGPEPFVHWMIYNISPNVSLLPQGIPAQERMEAPIQADQGVNSAGRLGYMGPMPPRGSGVHHYIFTLYALDAELGVRPGIENKQELLAAIKGHVIASAKLVGKYERGKTAKAA